MARDYKDEYRKFQGTSVQKKRRAERNKNRMKALKKGTVHKGDGYDLAHTSNGIVKKKAGVNRGSSSDQPGDKRARGTGSKRKTYTK
jgi:hypothetical protein